LVGSAGRLEIEPFADDPKRLVAVDRERIHEVGDRAVHVAAPSGAEAAEETAVGFVHGAKYRWHKDLAWSILLHRI
jgi:hypothetical protein